MKSTMIILALFLASTSAFARANIRCTGFEAGYEINGVLTAGQSGTKMFWASISKGLATKKMDVVDYQENQKGEFVSLILKNPETNRVNIILNQEALLILDDKGEVVERSKPLVCENN